MRQTYTYTFTCDENVENKIEMKGILHLCCLYGTFLLSEAHDLSKRINVVDSLDVRSIQTSTKIRDLGVGEQKTMKKPKIDSSKDKLSKNDDVSREKKVAKGKGKGKGGNNDGENNTEGKGMANMKGMMEKAKGKSKAPTLVETTTPSTTTTPIAITSSPAAPVPTATPKTIAPSGSNTESPIITSLPSPVALDTEAPTIAPVPIVETTAPMVLSPSVQPILVSPTNFAFIGSSNILVRYESINSADNVTLNQTMAAIDLTCDFLRNEAILPLGALEFACIWFLPAFDDNELTGFPVDITYAGSAAFPSDVTNISTAVLDASMISALTPPTVGNLTEMMITDLPPENPFSQTEAIYAVV